MLSIPRILIAVGLLAACQVGVYVIGEGAPPADVAPTIAAIEEVPFEIGGREGEDEPLDEEVFVATDAAYMLSRVYQTPDQPPVSLSVGVWSGMGVSLPHTPEICYVSNGWEMVEKRVEKLHVDDDETINVRYLTFAREGARAAVIYWGQVGGNTVIDRSGIQAVKQKMRFADAMPSTIKVHLHMNIRDSESPEELEELFRFAAEVRKHVRDIQ